VIAVTAATVGFFPSAWSLAAAWAMSATVRVVRRAMLCLLGYYGIIV